MNPLMGRMNTVMNLMNRVQQNPSSIADVLKENGRISDEQYNAIHGMKSPQEIGQYLIQTGSMTQEQAQSAYNQIGKGGL